MNKQKVKTYAIAILGTFLVVYLCSSLIKDSAATYELLNKPPLAPPAWLFPVVWAILYVLMGVSAARVKLSGADSSEAALTVYIAQLVVNCLWTLIFFGFGAYLFSLFWALLLLALVIIMMVMFRTADELAAKLQLPYILWLGFAIYLNAGIFILN